MSALATPRDAALLAESANPVYAERDLHDFPYGHGGRPCPFGFEHYPVPERCNDLRGRQPLPGEIACCDLHNPVLGLL